MTIDLTHTSPLWATDTGKEILGESIEAKIGVFVVTIGGRFGVNYSDCHDWLADAIAMRCLRWLQDHESMSDTDIGLLVRTDDSVGIIGEAARVAGVELEDA